PAHAPRRGRCRSRGGRVHDRALYPADPRRLRPRARRQAAPMTDRLSVVPDMTVVIVSWNTREHLARCLDALEGAAERLRVAAIVVDNGSADGSQAMVAVKFPRARLIQSPANVGFGRACNLGAAAGTGRAILLLNSDCELQPAALTTLLDALDADPTLGAVFARLTNADGTLQPSVHEGLPTPWTHAGDVVFASSLRYALYRAPALKRALLRGTSRRHATAHD